MTVHWPLWKDVAYKVAEICELVEVELKVVFGMEIDRVYDANMRGRDMVDYSEIRMAAEEEAVEAAMRGDVSQLARLLEPRLLNSIGRHLSDKTFALIVEFLTGLRNRNTGKLGVYDAQDGKVKYKGGAPKLSDDERRVKNAVHNALDVLPRIEGILERHYPDQKVLDLAITIAAKLKGAEERTLRWHRARPKNDPKRLPKESAPKWGG